jgi:acetyl esterase/lipase
MNKLAKAVVPRGWAAWNIEYRRVGIGGGGGGWPETFVDVAAAINHLTLIDGIDTHRVVTCGHSAGGHLALWAAARHRLPVGVPGSDVTVTVQGAVSLAGVGDLREAD